MYERSKAHVRGVIERPAQWGHERVERLGDPLCFFLNLSGQLCSRVEELDAD